MTSTGGRKTATNGAQHGAAPAPNGTERFTLASVLFFQLVVSLRLRLAVAVGLNSC